MKRDAIDFSAVPAHQVGMHCRLENWARDQHSGAGGHVSPMFRLYRSNEHWPGQTSIPVDTHDAAKLDAAIRRLPDANRAALVWYYVRNGSSPGQARKRLGMTASDLAQSVTDGRQMLINRRA